MPYVVVLCIYRALHAIICKSFGPFNFMLVFILNLIGLFCRRNMVYTSSNNNNLFLIILLTHIIWLDIQYFNIVYEFDYMIWTSASHRPEGMVSKLLSNEASKLYLLFLHYDRQAMQINFLSMVLFLLWDFWNLDTLFDIPFYAFKAW